MSLKKPMIVNGLHLRLFINDLLGDLDFVQVYLDDILITSNGTFQDHLQKLAIVFKRLEHAVPTYTYVSLLKRN
jgi:hypothetical protein